MGEVAEVVGGGTPKASDPLNFSEEGYRWITPADLSGFEGVYISKGRRDLSEKGFRSCSATMMPAGSVLMSSRAPIGYMAIAAGPLATNQGFKSFLCREGVVQEYVYFWLRFIRPKLEELGSGSTFAEISGRRAKEIPILIPPTTEQHRIAAALQRLPPQMSSIKNHLDRVPKILKRFRQTILSAACSGRLTEGWRDVFPASSAGRDPDTESWPSGWVPATAGDLFTWSSGRFLPKKSQKEGRYPVYGGNGISGYHDEFMVEQPTIVVGRVGALCGNVYLSAGKAWVTDNAIYAVQISPEVDLSYAKIVLERANLNADSGGSGQPFVNQTILNDVAFPIPPLPEQHKIVRRVQELFTLADATAKRVVGAGARTERITRAILARAFNGELVPTEAELARREGRAFESGAELLEQIRKSSTKPMIRPR